MLDCKTFESVVLCRLVSMCGHKRRLNLSQRQILSLFNRSNPKAVQKYLAKTRDLGLLVKAQESSGMLADTHIRGPYFDRDNTEVRASVTLSHSLWGKGGLLRDCSTRVNAHCVRLATPSRFECQLNLFSCSQSEQLPPNSMYASRISTTDSERFSITTVVDISSAEDSPLRELEHATIKAERVTSLFTVEKVATDLLSNRVEFFAVIFV